MPNQDITDTLKELGADRRDLGKSLMPTQISTHQTLSGLLVRRFEYECGHRHDTALLTPPKACPACRDLRHKREREEAERRRVVAQNRKRAAERAENAHDYGKRHWICRYCIQSRGADAYALGEGHASIFDKRIPRGFKR